MYYRLGQSYPRPFAEYTYPRPQRKRRYFRQGLGYAKVRNVYVEHTVTVTDVIALPPSHIPVAVPVSLVHNVTVSQIIQKIGKQYLKVISHDVTTASTIKSNRVLKRPVVHSILVTPVIDLLATHVTHNLTVSQVIKLKKIQNLRVTQSVTVSPKVFINSPRSVSLFDTVYVVDSKRYNQIFRMTVAQDVAINQSIHLPLVKIKVIDNVTVAHQINIAYTKNITHDINVFHQLAKQRQVNRNLKDILLVNSKFERNMIYNITTSPELISDFNRNIIVTRSLNDYPLLVKSNFDSILFIGSPGPHPVSSGTQIIYNYLMTLETMYGSIVLPIPELNDSISNNDSIELKRSMSGQLSAYIKRATTQVFSYSWILDFIKAAELKAWLKTNMSEKVTVTNWKGEVWHCDIISDSASFRAEAKYQGDPRQKTTITVEFEGVKILG